jgi:hypothetical protein
MVALYWAENFLETYWFIRDVLPTLRERGGEGCVQGVREGGRE